MVVAGGIIIDVATIDSNCTSSRTGRDYSK
jgi:hypothetical protein